MLKECPYYKRVSHTRAALMLTWSLAVVAIPAASDDDPIPPVWPIAAAWSSTFPVADVISLVMGPSRLFVVEIATAAKYFSFKDRSGFDDPQDLWFS